MTARTKISGLRVFESVNTSNLREHRDRKIELACVVTTVSRQISKRNGSEWARLTVEDFYGITIEQVRQELFNAFGSAGIFVVVVFGLFSRFGGTASADIPLIRGVDATSDVFVDGARDPHHPRDNDRRIISFTQHRVDAVERRQDRRPAGRPSRAASEYAHPRYGHRQRRDLPPPDRVAASDCGPARSGS